MKKSRAYPPGTWGAGYNDDVNYGRFLAMTESLFREEEVPVPACSASSGEGGKTALPRTAVRVRMPNRTQMEWRASDLESLLPAGHRARLVWGFIERPNQDSLYAGIKVVEGGSGGPPLRRRFSTRFGSTRRWKGWAARARWRA